MLKVIQRLRNNNERRRIRPKIDERVRPSRQDISLTLGVLYMSSSQSDFLTPQEVASYCGVALQTVDQWLHEGRLQAQLNAQGHQVKAGDLVDFMHQNHLAIPAELLNIENTSAPQGPKVLVVDENKATANAIEQVLKSMSLNVIQVNNGFDASVTYIQKKPQLMTLDLTLDGMSGIELIENLTATQTHRAKILVISDSMPSLMAKARAAGADAVLSKPLDRDSLKRSVRILLDL